MPRPDPPPVHPPQPGHVRYRMLVAYQGGAFHGFAVNPGVATVAATLQKAFVRIMGREVPLTCAGRTDAGVHASGQVVSFDVEGSRELDVDRVRGSMNSLCAPSVVVKVLEIAPDDFDARFSAHFRRYEYLVFNSRVPDPFLHPVTYRVSQQLDLEAMNVAAQHFVGEHNFASFCRTRFLTGPDGGEVEATMDRTVHQVGWDVTDTGLLRFKIEAGAFCQQMVRSIAGTTIDVGLGKLAPGDIPGIFAARDRNVAGQVAPPQGLTLVYVGYNPPVFENWQPAPTPAPQR